jgi:hypothetical protein
MADVAGGMIYVLSGSGGLIGEGTVNVSWDLKRGEAEGEEEGYGDRRKRLVSSTHWSIPFQVLTDETVSLRC